MSILALGNSVKRRGWSERHPNKLLFTYLFFGVFLRLSMIVGRIQPPQLVSTVL
jgi:hypothetical protein